MARVKALRSGLERAAGGAWRLDQGRAYEIADPAADALVAMGAVVRVGAATDAEGAEADQPAAEAVDPGPDAPSAEASEAGGPEPEGATGRPRRRRRTPES